MEQHQNVIPRAAKVSTLLTFSGVEHDQLSEQIHAYMSG
jgi:hypothetical protein